MSVFTTSYIHFISNCYKNYILPKLASVTMGGSKEGNAHLASSEVNAFGVHFGELAVSMAQFTLLKKR